MWKWALRFFLLRVLPGRLIWVFTLMDAWFLWKSIQRRLRGQTAANDPRGSRTAPPRSLPTSSPATSNRPRT